MLEFPRWKYFLVALIVLVSALYALPNVYPQDPALQVAAQGGAIDDALATKVRGLLEAQKITYKSVAKEGDDLVVSERPSGDFSRTLTLSEGLDASKLSAHYENAEAAVARQDREAARRAVARYGEALGLRPAW